ncbi:hypothetical protein LIER_13944 [Lithospermum erythrorhizon]|uniref:Uncharacterized protein n=1 Tax=Lithospermum erythrorhizon TaxID=34254 RepID=A0AAV3PY83_LITER
MSATVNWALIVDFLLPEPIVKSNVAIPIGYTECLVNPVSGVCIGYNILRGRTNLSYVDKYKILAELFVFVASLMDLTGSFYSTFPKDRCTDLPSSINSPSQYVFDHSGQVILCQRSFVCCAIDGVKEWLLVSSYSGNMKFVYNELYVGVYGGSSIVYDSRGICLFCASSFVSESILVLEHRSIFFQNLINLSLDLLFPGEVNPPLYRISPIGTSSVGGNTGGYDVRVNTTARKIPKPNVVNGLSDKKDSVPNYSGES